VRLLLIRHGETEANAGGVYQGHSDSPLTPRGRAQADAVAAWLATQADTITAIARSDLGRVADTARPSERALRLDAHVDLRLREVDVGTWSGKTRTQIADADPEGAAAWRRGEDVARGGGETSAALRLRVWDALLDLAKGPDGVCAVFTHGGPIRAAVSVALGLEIRSDRLLAGVANGSVSVLDVEPAGDARLVAYNRLDHLGSDRL
jgi:glucosyl-3-phosphoglycerate phosphatase